MRILKSRSRKLVENAGLSFKDGLIFTKERVYGHISSGRGTFYDESATKEPIKAKNIKNMSMDGSVLVIRCKIGTEQSQIRYRGRLLHR